MLRGIAILSTIIALTTAALGDETKPEPFRVSRAAGGPKWLDFGLAARSRVELLANDFRADSGTDAAAPVFRILLPVEASFEPLIAGLELEGSHAYAGDDAAIGTSSVDTFTILQAYAGLRRADVLASGDLAELRVGRITMDVGSRRLVARNRYRNTINGFTGLDARWRSPGGQTVRAFAVLPVSRRPSDAASLADNSYQIDKENTDTLFWGAYFGGQPVFGGAVIEAFAFGLHERDGEVATKNRQLFTPGFRLYRKAAPGALDFQVEGAVQVGTSRASKADMDTDDLDHRAFFARAEVGYTFDAPWKPDVIAQYDYASGDGDPGDGTQGRFDTLFGARRFDFGPTGIYGPFARSNLTTPGVRVKVEPLGNVTAFAAYRLYWLASSKDAWTTSGISDPTGDSGSFLGHQAEVRARWHLLPENLDLEAGLAYFVHGGFARNAPGGTEGPSALFYTSIAGTI